MKTDILQFVKEKTEALIESPTCCQEAKDMAKAWLNAIGTEQESEQTKAYIQELEEDIVTIENLIAFSSSDEGKAYFGAEKASEILQHAKDIQKQGAQYCDCPACSLVLDILEKKDEMEI